MGKDMNRKVNFIFVLWDMLKTVGKCFYAITFISFISIIFIFLKCDIVIDSGKLPHTFVTIVPEIIGFLIAGLAIIMGFNKESLQRLSTPTDDNEIPLKAIVASFSISLLILLATFVVSLLYINIDFACKGCCSLWSALVVSGVVISVESIIHVIFHLFATGSFLVYDEKDDK